MKTMTCGIFTCNEIILAKYSTLIKNKYLNCPEIVIQPLKPTSDSVQIFNELNKHCSRNFSCKLQKTDGPRLNQQEKSCTSETWCQEAVEIQEWWELEFRYVESKQYSVSLSHLFLSLNMYFVLSLGKLASLASKTYKEMRLPTVPLVTFYMLSHSKRLFLFVNSKYTFLN